MSLTTLRRSTDVPKFQFQEVQIPVEHNGQRNVQFYTAQQVSSRLRKVDKEIVQRIKITEWEEKNSWEKMCPHGLF